MNDQWFDGHLDLAYLAVNGRDVRSAACDPNVGCVTLPALRSAGVRWLCGTIFTEIGLNGSDVAHRYRDHDDLDGAEHAGLLQLDWYEAMEREQQLQIVRTRDDLDRPASPEPRVNILMEGADPIRSPADVPKWHARGLRMVGLSWAAGSRFAGGNGPPPGVAVPAHYRTGALTPEGIDLIQALDDCGIVHDASHLSDASFDGLMQHARGPIVATHSNCRALLGEWQRHMRDDQIRTIAQRGGVIGLNLFGKFLAHDRSATIDDCIAHIEYIVKVTGRRDVVVLGSDMDGGFSPADLPTGLEHPSKLGGLAAALRSRGWSDAEVAGFTHDNWLRMLREALPRSNAG